MASGTRTISLSSFYDSPPSSPRVPNVPIAGEDAGSMATHRLIQEKAKKLAEAPSLKGRVSTTTTPEKENKWADLSSSSGSYGSSLTASGGEDPRFNTSFDTPPSPVKKRKELTTPDAVQTIEGFLVNEDLGYDLTPKSGEAMTQAVEKLDDLDSPYRSEQKALVRAPFSAALVRTGSTSEVLSPLVPRRLFSTDKKEEISGKWTVILARSLDVSFLDAKHIEDLEHTGGFHVCPAGHPRDASVQSRRTNPATGVWCGKVFELNDSQKIAKSFSSFVPREMSSARYEILIAEAQGIDEREIARQDNRRLYEVVDGKNRFMIECYRQLSDTLIRSAIPIFHYEVYEGTETSFEVDYSFKLTLDGDDPLKQLTYKVVYETLFELLQTKPEAIVYNTDEKIIVDLGMLFENCPIDQGLLVEISKEFLP